MASELISSVRQKIESLPYGRHDVRVYGSLRLRVQIRCISQKTADQWAVALAPVFKAAGGHAQIAETLWDMKDQSSRAGESVHHVQRGFMVSCEYLSSPASQSPEVSNGK